MELEQASVDRRRGYEDGGVADRSAGFDPWRCDCDNDCPGSPQCICIVIYGKPEHPHGHCLCWCSGGVAEDRRHGLDQKVDLSVRAAPLSRVGLVLASLSTADIFVPALELDKPVTLSLKEVTLETAIREAGLITLDRG